MKKISPATALPNLSAQKAHEADSNPAAESQRPNVGWTFTSEILEFLKFNLDPFICSFPLTLLHLEPFLIFYFFFLSSSSLIQRNNRICCSSVPDTDADRLARQKFRLQKFCFFIIRYRLVMSNYYVHDYYLHSCILSRWLAWHTQRHPVICKVV